MSATGIRVIAVPGMGAEDVLVLTSGPDAGAVVTGTTTAASGGSATTDGASGRLLGLDPDGTVTVLEDVLAFANGVAASPGDPDPRAPAAQAPAHRPGAGTTTPAPWCET